MVPAAQRSARPFREHNRVSPQHHISVCCCRPHSTLPCAVSDLERRIQVTTSHSRGSTAQAVDNRHYLQSSSDLGMDVAELSVTAELLQRTESADGSQAKTAAAEAASAAAGADSLFQQPWVQELIASHKDSKLVFSADGYATGHHLSTGLSQDHLFLSLLQNNMLQDMVVLYAAERKIITVLKFGVPVCGHPTIVHGGLISAIFDETFGVLLYAAGRWGHADCTMVFTARLEVDYKKPLPAESTIICEAVVESMEGRKIWLNAKLTDPSGDTVYAASRALFVKPKQAPALPQQQPQQQQEQQQQQQAVSMQS